MKSDSKSALPPLTPAEQPGSAEMPPWNRDELIDAPHFTWRNWIGLIGPGLLMCGAAVGGGEWLLGPAVTARYGGAMLWLTTLSILGQVLYNLEISRYTLYTGEPIFTGKFRTLPGPRFWFGVYLLLDFGSIFPYLAANAATPLGVLVLVGMIPTPDDNPAHWWLMKGLATFVFFLCMLPMIYGGKVYNTLRAIMFVKLVVVFSFLLSLGFLYSSPETWQEILTGFLRFGTVPVTVPAVTTPVATALQSSPATTAVPPPVVLDNIFVAFWEGRPFPRIDFQMVAFIAGLAAIAGGGGLTNTPISNYTRDQGWGMGYHVGAIPSVFGGQRIELSHVGSVFVVSPESLQRWKRWYRHILRDQLCVWMPGCFVGVALPSMLSVEFLTRGTQSDQWNMAVMTATKIYERAADPPSALWVAPYLHGTQWGNILWFMTILCGFLVLAPSMTTTADGFIRRWVDVFWTASKHLRKLETHKIRIVYCTMLTGYAIFGLSMLWLNKPAQLVAIATTIYNFALGISCWHTIFINSYLLPREIRPHWIVRTLLALVGVYFFGLASITAIYELTK